MKCINSPGTYHCECEVGYYVNHNGGKCSAKITGTVNSGTNTITNVQIQVQAKMNFWEARAHCEKYEGYLIDINGPKTTLSPNKDRKYWIGLQQFENVWKWQKGSLKYRNWAVNEPNYGNYSCTTIGYVNGTFQWYDESCNLELWFFCHIEMFKKCHQLRFKESNGQFRCICKIGYSFGLNQRSYKRNGTQCDDINECLTDNGGCGSLKCINTAGSYNCECEEDYDLNPNGGKCVVYSSSNSHYFVSTRKLTFWDARIDCEERSGYLTGISGPNEMEYLSKQLDKSKRYWISLHRLGNKPWQWTKGSLQYKNWAANEPNLPNGTAACTTIQNHNASYVWHDEECSKLELLFICRLEKKYNKYTMNITTSQEVTYIFNYMKTYVNDLDTDNVTQTTSVLDEVLSIYNKLIEVDAKILRKAQKENGTTNSLLRYIEHFASKLRQIFIKNESAPTITVTKQNLAFTMTSIEKTDIEVVAKSKDHDYLTDVSISISESKNRIVKDEPDILVLIRIPKETFSLIREVVHSFYYRNASLFITEKNRESESESKIVQSAILSVNIGSKTIKNLPKPIILIFKKLFSENIVGENICSFWDFNSLNENDLTFGRWSSQGCKESNIRTDKDYVTCECNHLTNFALLLDVSQTRNNPMELKIVTWIGCGISILCLVFSIITFMIFRNLLKKAPQKLLLAFCLSLLMLLIIFVAGAEQTSSRIGCQIIAGMIHYFILTTSCWMLMEAINLYRFFIKIYTDSIEYFFTKASLFAWGAPAIIVGATAVIAPTYYGNGELCIVHGTPFYFGVLLPVASILVFNVVMLIVVMRSVINSGSKHRNKNENAIVSARIAFGCNLILGTTWTFGIMAVSGATMVFQWLFCIFNSLQGFFIFIFYVLRIKEIRDQWKRLLGVNEKPNKTLTVELTAR